MYQVVMMSYNQLMCSLYHHIGIRIDKYLLNQKHDIEMEHWMKE